jgi:hypothetical protein
MLAGGGTAADEALRDQDATAVADAEDALVESLWCNEHRHSRLLSTSSGPTNAARSSGASRPAAPVHER